MCTSKRCKVQDVGMLSFVLLCVACVSVVNASELSLGMSCCLSPNYNFGLHDTIQQTHTFPFLLYFIRNFKSLIDKLTNDGCLQFRKKVLIQNEYVMSPDFYTYTYR